MKKNIAAAIVFCMTAGAPFYSFATAPCEVVLCMYGKTTGNSGGNDCKNAEKAFFKINAFKKHHRFNPTKTFNMRKEFLGKCPEADPESVSKILSKFGKVRG